MKTIAMTPRRKKFTMNMDADLHRDLKVFCAEQDVQMATVIESLIRIHLDADTSVKHPKPRRSA